MSRSDVSLILFGGIAGATGKTSAAPVERLKVLFQVGRGDAPTSMLTAFRTIFREEGLMGLWKGNFVNCLRIFPHRGVLFSCNDLYRPYLTKFGLHDRYTGFMTGSLAGMTATLATYPMDLVRTQRAGTYGVEANGLWGMMVENYKGVPGRAASGGIPGIGGLYRGLGLTMLTALPYEGLKFGLYPMFKSKMPEDLLGWKTRKEDGSLKTISMVLCGGTAGCIAGTLTYSNDTVRRIMQIAGRAGNHGYPQFRNAVHAYKYCYQTNGIAGFYRGLVPNLIRLIPNIGVEFAVYELLKQTYMKSSET